MKILITGGAGFIGPTFVRHVVRSTTGRVINDDTRTYAGDARPLRASVGGVR